MQLAYGLNGVVPEIVTTAWGARLIAPADLVANRQDFQSTDDDAQQRLLAWLNGGVLDAALARLSEAPLPESHQVFPIYEDADGTIVASTKRSHGYVYVAGWLHPEAVDQPDVPTSVAVDVRLVQSSRFPNVWTLVDDNGDDYSRTFRDPMFANGAMAAENAVIYARENGMRIVAVDMHEGEIRNERDRVVDPSSEVIAGIEYRTGRPVIDQ